MELILTFLLSSAPADAGPVKDWWRGFCERNLIAKAQWPLSDVSTDRLIQHYRLTGSVDAAMELKYRMSSDWNVTFEQRQEITEIME